MEDNIQMGEEDIGYVVRIGVHWKQLRNETGVDLFFLGLLIPSVLLEGYITKEEFRKPCEVLNSRRKNNELNYKQHKG